MRSFRIVKIVCSATVILAAVAGIFAWVNYKIHRIPIPKREKLADCTSESLSFPMAVRYHEPYAIVLGLPHTSALSNFRGEMQLRQGTKVVARIPINSDDMTCCNWLDHPAGAGLAGYILTWGRTNQGERLGEILMRGQSYDVQVTFSERPPRGSSLWLSSFGKVGEP